MLTCIHIASVLFLFLFRLGKVLLAISVIDYCLRAFWSMPTNQSITCWKNSSHTYLTSGICWWAFPPKPCREMLLSVVYALLCLYLYALWYSLSSLKRGDRTEKKTFMLLYRTPFFILHLQNLVIFHNIMVLQEFCPKVKVTVASCLSHSHQFYISEMPGGSFITSGTKLHLDSWMNWLEVEFWQTCM